MSPILNEIWSEATELHWETVCHLHRLEPARGVAAVLGDVEVALFRAPSGTLHAVGNVDPFSEAAVLSRGMLGDRRGEPIVASPIHQQAFSLVSGRCLDDPKVGVPVYPVRVIDDWVQVGMP